MQPDLSKRLFKLIKSENYVVTAYETAGRERESIASQLSDWGEATGDDAVSDLSDKLGVLLCEMGEQEEVFAQNLEDYRGVLKQIRNTESSVQPSRNNKAKISDEIAKLKYKEPENTKIPQLEQQLVRAEAENLVAEAQLTNITRQKIKEAYAMHCAAVIERAEKQAILARHARRLLNLLDDTPVQPGDTRAEYDQEPAARQVLNDAEDEMKSWQLDLEPVHTAVMGQNLMPAHAGIAAGSPREISPPSSRETSGTHSEVHPAYRKGSGSSSNSSSRRVASRTRVPYPEEERERVEERERSELNVI
jgi:hypothetical protein